MTTDTTGVYGESGMPPPPIYYTELRILTTGSVVRGFANLSDDEARMLASVTAALLRVFDVFDVEYGSSSVAEGVIRVPHPQPIGDQSLTRYLNCAVAVLKSTRHVPFNYSLELRTRRVEA